jgi:hypothetical protein
MHAPSLSGTLPAGVDPIPVPDTEREAELLVLLLEAGLYPKCKDEGRSGRHDGRQRGGEAAR